MPEYVVSLSRRTSDGVVESLQVAYEDEDYKSAWVGARTVCRLGTSPKRVFRVPQIGIKFKELEPVFIVGGVWTVKQIFARNTRKKGKQRMMTLTTESLLDALRRNGDQPVTPELEQLFRELLGVEGGVRITVAAAARLGLDVEHSGIPPGAEQVGKTA